MSEWQEWKVGRIESRAWIFAVGLVTGFKIVIVTTIIITIIIIIIMTNTRP